MAGPKFYIYGGCRWREVCTTSGRVDGWGNVQFLTVRSGRLQVARKNTVLRGLRALAASKPTSVHDGLPLSQIRHNNSIEDKKEHNCSQYQHHHCCCKQQDLSLKSDVIFNNIFKAASTCSAAVQCSLEVSTSTPNLNKSITGPSKTSEARTKNGVKRLLSKRKRSTSEDEDQERNKNGKTIERRNKSDKELELSLLERSRNLNNNKYDKRQTHRQQISSSEEEGLKAVIRKNLPQRENQQSPVKSRYVSKAPNGTRESLRSNTINKKRKKILNNIHSSSDESSEIQSKPAIQSSQHINEFWNTLFKTKPKRRSKRKLLTSDDDTYEEERKARKTSKKIVESNQESRRKHTQEIENGDLMCKELMIGEDDIELLRSFIEKDEANIFGVDLELFDTDDEYKRKIFYKINPLVNVARCKRIAAMLRDGRSQSDDVSLEDFISTLGLRSVLDIPSQTSSKYKMRARRNPSNGGPDKENHRTSKHNPNTSASSSKSKVLVERLRDGANKKNKIISKKKGKVVGLIGKMTSKPTRSRKEQDEVVLLSSDSESDSVFESKRESAFEKSKRVTSEVRRPDAAAALERDNKKEGKASGTGSRKANGPATGRGSGRVSGKAGGREYSRAEDEAIVAWVRGAERARRVNGNQLWIELQPLHQQKTGNCELKSRKKPQRRNSLLTEPRVRSAWSRRPRPPPRESPSRSRSVSPARSPTPAPSSSPSLPVRADSSHYSSRSSSGSFATTGRSTPIDRRRSLRNSSAKKEERREEKPTARKLRSSAPTSPPPRTPTYSQLTQRFADARPPSTVRPPRPPRPSRPSRPPPPSPPARPASPARPRTRRLYNPHAT
ncbi:PHD finger protein rhinoceros-like isoform X2 [Vanessa atalanta]|uniref:PHD finger protein rhinoceros-like isoform X2 n=1 Tax=Vanessa atalanta TaxID=42275 RepID=UPI001FCCE9FE|nr:PHD finger protein rhinoceros-like isoform X2 [Vanessa atalanta]